jgi:hypothetical protein
MDTHALSVPALAIAIEVLAVSPQQPGTLAEPELKEQP